MIAQRTNAHVKRKEAYVNASSGKGPFTCDPDRELPNIILITMDMVPPEFHNGEIDVQAPVRESLRKDGINFTRVYSASPLCGPSRASFLTGRHPYITGNAERAHDGHATELREDDIIWPEYLKARGYHCRHIGKSHVGTSHFIRAFSENSSPWNRWSPPWYNEDLYIQFLKNKGLERFTFKKEIRGRTGRGGNRIENDGARDAFGNSYGGWLADQNGSPFPEDATYPAFLVDRAVSSLETRESDGKPFYLQLDFFGPHQPFAIPGGWEKREKEIRSKVAIPESWLEWEAAGFPEQTDDPRVYDLYRKNWGITDRETVIDYRTANQLQYELLDVQVGRLINYLKAHKLYDSTWIIYLADHGEMNCRKGCVDKGAYLNPQVLQVPLVLKPAAGHESGAALSERAGESIDTPSSLLDMYPAVCEITGMEIPARTDGFSLLETLRTGIRPPEKPVMFDVWNHVAANPCVGHIAEYKETEYLFSYNATSYRDELYPLENPGRLVNVLDEDADRRQAILARMHAALSGDVRWDIYKGYFELEYGDVLQIPPADTQKFE